MVHVQLQISLSSLSQATNSNISPSKKLEGISIFARPVSEGLIGGRFTLPEAIIVISLLDKGDVAE